MSVLSRDTLPRSQGTLSDVLGSLGSHEQTFREIFGYSSPMFFASPANVSNVKSQFIPLEGDSDTGILDILTTDTLSNIVSQVSSQSDLVSLGCTCSLFRYLVTERLYKRIQIVDRHQIITNQEKALNYISNDFTYLDVTKLTLFARSIVNNFQLLDYYIEEIDIVTNSEKTHTFNGYSDGNMFEIIYDLVSRHPQDNKSRPLTLLNFDFANVKMFQNYLAFTRIRMARSYKSEHVFDLTPSDGVFGSHEPDLATPNTLVQRKEGISERLRFFQLLDLNDLNVLPLSVDKLSFFSVYGNNYNPLKPFLPNYNGLRVLYNLSSLYLNSSAIASEFFQKVSTIFQSDNLEKVKLTTLSITIFHDIIDDEHHFGFHDLATIFDLNYLKNFEIKSKCYCCHSCFYNFFSEWKNYYDGNCCYDSDHSSSSHVNVLGPLAASSYCYFPTGSAVSLSKHTSSRKNFANIEKLSICGDSSNSRELSQYEHFALHNLRYFTNLKYLYLKIYDCYPTNHQQQNINDEKKIRLFNEIFRLTNLQTLIIPDFFYNWGVSRNSLDKSDDNHNFIWWLNRCSCDECHEARRIFKKHSKLSLLKNSLDKLCYLENLPDVYSPNYYCILNRLRARFPFSAYLDNMSSGLDILKYPINSPDLTFLYDHCDYSDYSRLKEEVSSESAALIRLLIHSYASSIEEVVANLPCITTVVFGGVYFHVDRTVPRTTKLVAIYDDYEKIF
ncbi:hypothetical protein DASC09_016610 [Saccharomycopsis crataegensis]|uniref:F-box domain-containing protein n=1 Tax=Saccharomycopsis crataegensis TaxID=43959 RepID=A0AAV5QI86_9ASCO|nr:hypothetical protein DASC09_016610 [Saccharomycopsis crataegensis]